MKNKKILAVIIIMIISCIAWSCKKEQQGEIGVAVEITELGQNTLSLKIEVPEKSAKGGAFLALHPNPSAEDIHVIRPQQNGIIQINFAGLQSGTKYYLRGYAEINGEKFFSEIISITTHAGAITKNANNIELHQVQLNGQVYLDPNIPINYWFEWGVSQFNCQTPTKTISGNGPNDVNDQITGLNWGANYKFRLAIRSENKVFYGQTVYFKTLGEMPVISNISIDINTIEKLNIKFKVHPNLLPTNTRIDYGTSAGYYPNQAICETITGDSSQLIQISLTAEKAQEYYLRLVASNDLGECVTDTNIISLAFIFEGHAYKAIKIGDQYWLAENFKGLHYQNGDPIPYIRNNEEWYNATSGALCYFEHREDIYEKYGALYNWLATNDPRGLAPAGWKIPTFEDFMNLRYFMENLNISIFDQGGALKSKGLESWGENFGLGENNSEGNIFGFNALGAGARATFENSNLRGVFGAFKEQTSFWTKSEFGYTASAPSLIGPSSSFFTGPYSNKYYGLSVRLIKE